MTGNFSINAENKEGTTKPNGKRSHSNNIPSNSYNEEPKKTKGSHGRL